MTVDLAHDLRGEGPLLVLIHGITEDRRSWDPLMDALAAGHRVLRVDLRGHGASPKGPSYGMDDLAADVHAVVGRVAGDERPLVVGHSLGGTVASAYGALYDTRGVVNVDQTLNLGPMQAQVKELEPLLNSEAYPMVMGQMFEGLRGQLDDAENERLTGIRRYDSPDVTLGIWGVMIENTPEQLAATVDALFVPQKSAYLALNGFDLGPDYTAWLQARVPHAQVVTWDGVGHYPHLVRPADFVTLVTGFEATL